MLRRTHLPELKNLEISTLFMMTTEFPLKAIRITPSQRMFPLAIALTVGMSLKSVQPKMAMWI